MTKLPPWLEQDLRRLPIGCGLPWLDNASSQHRKNEWLPVFVIRLPEGFAFANFQFRTRDIQDYRYPEGTLLELFFEIALNKELPLPFSFLLAPGLPEQHAFCRALVNTTTIEIGVYTPDMWCIGWRRMVWPELSRQKLTTIMRERHGQGSWNALLERWQRSFGEHGRTPLPSRLSSSFTPSPAPTQPGANRTRRPSSPLPSAVHQLHQAAPLEQVVWQREPLRCFVKVPSDLSFERLTIEFQTLSLVSYVPEGPLAVLPFAIPTRRKEPTIHGHCLWNPTDPVDRALLSQLATAQKIELVGCANGTAALVPLGCKDLSWGSQKRQAVQTLLAQTRTALTLWPEAKERFLREQPQKERQVQADKAERQAWNLPSSWKQQMRGADLRAFAVWHKGEHLLPRLLIRVPEGTQVRSLALTASAFNIYRYQGSVLVCLHLILRDEASGAMPVDIFFDPVSDRKKLKALTLPGSIELLAVADTDQLPILGALQWTWPASLQERARQIWTVIRQVKQSGRWNVLVKEHYRLFPPVTTFHHQEPRTVTNLPLTVSPAAPSRQIVSSRNTAIASQKGSSPSVPPPQPLSSFPKPVTSASLSLEHTRLLQNISELPLVERCILRQRLLAREEYQKSYPPSQLAFWRMLLPLALEQSRKFLWRPEAVALTEERRLQREEAQNSVRLPRFPRVHLWFEFDSPIATCVAADTAAVFLFAADDPELLRRFARYTDLSAYALKYIQHTYYQPARHFFALNVVNQRGEMVWAMNLPGTGQGKQAETGTSWQAPPWFTCASVSCLFHRADKEVSSAHERREPCASCRRAHDFFSTWMVSAWKGLLGMHRSSGNVLDYLSTLGETHRETTTSIRPGIDEASLLRKLVLEHQYRIVRHIDIAIPPQKRRSQEPKNPRGSWVDALTAVDPSLVDFDEREIPERTRTLHDPRFAKYIEKHGTNQVKVRPHQRTVPLRSDPKRMTEVTAEMSKAEQEQQDVDDDER